MLCPFYLSDHKQFQKEKIGFSCPKCKEAVPTKYINDYYDFSPVVLSTVGFRGHGKTVYLASLLYNLRRMNLYSERSNFRFL